MHVTIKDVAKAAGVSVATVSRVINGIESVDEALKERVEQKVDELGFKPNHLARSLKSDVTNTIGVAVSDISNPFFINVARQIENIIRKSGYTMLMVSTDSDPEKEIDNIHMFEAKRVDGMIISPNSNEIADSIKNINCPIIAIDRKVLKNIYDSVYVDKEKSMYDAVCYLYERGHRNISMVTGSKELSTNYDRFNGYIKAHYDCGMAIDNNNILFGQFDTKFGKDAFEKIMSKENPPTAIISGSVVITTGILIKAKSMGINIPDKVSIISFGPMDLEELLDIKVTYIESLQTEIGQIAGEMIINRIKNPGLPVKLSILQAKIIEGNSVRTII
jgi:LacI family transcriptional regulator